jgi:hypothetical protein
MYWKRTYVIMETCMPRVVMHFEQDKWPFKPGVKVARVTGSSVLVRVR